MKKIVVLFAILSVFIYGVSMAQADVLTSEYQDYSFNVSDRFLHGTSGFHGDVNNDGDEEFVTAKMAYAMDEQFSTFPVYIYDKNGKDITNEILAEEMRVQFVKRILFADFNGDGKTDMYTIASGWEADSFDGDASNLAGEENQLWLSGTDGKLHRALLPGGKVFNHEGDCADIDNDGDIDIFVCAFGTPQNNYSVYAYFLINDGKGIFTLETVEKRVVKPANYNIYHQYSATFADVNNDGNADLILGQSNPSENPLVVLNNGKGHFSGAIILPWAKNIGEKEQYNNTIAVFDFNNDGYIDIIIAGQYEPTNTLGGYVQFLKNNNGTSFTDVTTDFDMDGVINWTSRKIDIIDYDNNGFKDIVIAALIPVWKKFPDLIAPPFPYNGYIFKNNNYIYTKIDANEFFGNRHSDFGMGTFLAMSNDKAKFAVIAGASDGVTQFHMFSYKSSTPLPDSKGASGGGGCNINSSIMAIVILLPLLFVNSKRK